MSIHKPNNLVSIFIHAVKMLSAVKNFNTVQIFLKSDYQFSSIIGFDVRNQEKLFLINKIL